MEVLVEKIQQLTEVQQKKVLQMVNQLLEEEKVMTKRKQLQSLLKNGPTWSEETYQTYQEGRKHLENWSKG